MNKLNALGADVQPPLSSPPPSSSALNSNAGKPGAGVPVKFIDPETGAVNVDALVQSYLALERKLGQRDSEVRADPETLDHAAMLKALGVPDTPEQYRIEILEDYLERNLEMEAVLHAAGFTESQVQLVYDLAAETLAPLVAEVVRTAQGAGDIARLEAHFGGPDRWKEIRRQMQKWARKNLPGEAFHALCGSFDGVMVLHRMMGAGDEPGLTHGGDGGEMLTEAQLKRLMNDPRYWRDHDPALSRKVQHGFRQLYPEGG